MLHLHQRREKPKILRNNESLTLNLQSPTGKTDYNQEAKTIGSTVHQITSKQDKENLNIILQNENSNYYFQEK